MSDVPPGLYGLAAAAAEHFPEKLAVAFPEREIRYRELIEETDRLASALANHGLGADDLIGLWLPNSIEWILLCLAANKLGITVIPLNTRYRTDEVTHIIENARLTALFFTEKSAGWEREVEPMIVEMVPELGDPARAAEGFASHPSLRLVISLSPSRAPGIQDFAELLAAADATVPEAVMVDADHAAYVQYTSGTTGRAKGAMLRNESVRRQAHNIASHLGMREDDILVSGLPFYHVAGFVGALFTSFAARATLVTMSHFDAGAVLRAAEQYHATVIRGVETMFVQLMEHPAFAATDLSSLRVGWCGGTNSEVLRQVHRKLDIELVNNFGMSETTASAAMSRLDDPLEKRLKTSGRPVDGVEIKIVSLDGREELPAGEPGEIVVRGWNVMVGYIGMPEVTAEVITAEGWFHTGDKGHFDEDGFLHFQGKIADGIRVGGENVSAGEVEATLLNVPGVLEAYVVAKPDEVLGQVAVAFVRAEKDAVSATQIIEHCRGRMASFKVPRDVIFVDEFPLTASGKVQKVKLREAAAADPERVDS